MAALPESAALLLSGRLLEASPEPHAAAIIVAARSMDKITFIITV
jgi:hypothetical protein